jgi:hypothetical protein
LEVFVFERAVLRKGAGLPTLDLGIFAETLLFYNETHLVLDPGTTFAIVDRLGFDVLSRLVSEGHCKLSYHRNFLGAQTNTQNGIASYNLVDFFTSGRVNELGKNWDEERDLAEIFCRKGYDQATARSTARKIMKIAPREKMRLAGRPINLCEMGTQDVMDRDYAIKAARISVLNKLPQFTIPDNWRFVAHPLDENGNFYVESNFDVAEINRLYQARAPGDSFTIASILADIFEARGDMVFASKHMAEIVTSPLNSKLMQTKFDLINLRRESSASDIDLFQDVHLEGKKLREVINSGERTFSEFLDLLDEARKFKDWLKGADQELGLLKEYHRAVTKTSWLEKLPSKSTRFALMVGAGALLDTFVTGGLATAGGLSLGAADTFLIDKFLQGWRPNQFVENGLEKFVEKSP